MSLVVYTFFVQVLVNLSNCILSFSYLDLLSGCLKSSSSCLQSVWLSRLCDSLYTVFVVVQTVYLASRPHWMSRLLSGFPNCLVEYLNSLSCLEEVSMETTIINLANLGFLACGILIFLGFLGKISGKSDFQEGFRNVSENIWRK